MQVAPDIIHFIWLGSHIPEKYFTSIVKLDSGLRAKKSNLKIYLWCDKIVNIYATASKLALPVTFENIIVKTMIDDLLPKLEADPIFNDKLIYKNRFWQLKYYTQLESIGAYNFATVSDLYRLAILWAFGGLYSDTDIEFGAVDITVPEELPLGLKALVTRLELDLTIINGSNDIILTYAKCKYIKQVLDESLGYMGLMQKASLYRYNGENRVDTEVSKSILCLWTYNLAIFHSQAKYAVHITPFDAKRCIKPLKFLPYYNGRVSMSVECGVVNFLECVKEIFTKEVKAANLSQGCVSPAEKQNIFAKISLGNSDKAQVFGIPIKRHSDMSWVNKAEKGTRVPSYTV